MAVLFTIGLQAWTGCFSIPGNRYAAFYAQGGTMRHQIIELDCDYSRAGIGAPQQKATLHTYILDNSLEMQPFRRRPMVLICPGGGYEFTSFREGEHIAVRMNALGFQAAILKYSCKPAVFPAPQLEAAAAVALIRKNAAAWHIHPKKIIAAGFSAGGHLAASLGTLWNEPFLSELTGVKPALIRPNALLLCYPVITSGEFAHKGSFKALLAERHDELLESVSLEKRVTSDTPPAFIWHTVEDQLVPVENSLLFAQALRAKGVLFEMHLYQRGGHGLAAATEETANSLGWGIQEDCQGWIDLAGRWIRSL